MKVYKKGLNYWMDLRVRGKRIRRSLGTPEYYLALDKAREITEELRRPKPAGTDIAEFFEKYRAWARETKPSSFKTEDYRLTWLKGYFEGQGITMLEAISPYAVEQMRAEVRAQDRRTEKARPASRGTANRYCALVRVLINKATDWGLFKGDNPVSRVKFYREGEKVRPLTEAEIRRVIEAARAISASKDTSPMGRAIYDICILILNTGLRRSEVLNLRWSDVIDDELRVRGKGGKVRFTPLNEEAARLVGQRPRLTAFIFDVPNRNAPHVMRRVTETITRRAKISFHVHLLRHAFASRLLAAGIDIVTVSDLLGHGKSMTTLLYTHSNPELKKRAVCVLRGDFSAPVVTPEEAEKTAPASNGGA